MKPHRIRMTHNLLVNYGLYRKMQIFRPFRTSAEDMTKFHSDDYIKFLKWVFKKIIFFQNFQKKSFQKIQKNHFGGILVCLTSPLLIVTTDVIIFRHIRPDNMNDYQKQMQRFNVGEDCPVFDGLFEFCQISTGGSIAGAVKLNKRHTGYYYDLKSIIII